ncbi:hypothetical protein LCGC14_3122990 [marine sediment metagenome]|uniref:Uncharacterized protein n=1 Tax=marine sediment metagenome TaxID=412755 RepID=A0A0F8Y957_9ZZZZ
MRRIYEIQRRRGPKPWPWERFYLKELPKRGPGCVVAPNESGGPWLRIRAYLQQMKPGEMLYRCRDRIRVVER